MIKKIFLSLLLVISFLFLSGFTTLAESENKVYVQEEEDVEPPLYLSELNYYRYNFEQENAYTYEYLVTYFVSFNAPENLTSNDYYLIPRIDVNFRKGINRNTNSYEFVQYQEGITGKQAVFRFTVLKSLVDSNYSSSIAPLFYNDLLMYVNATTYIDDDLYNDAYNRGYEAGYEDGFKDIDVSDYFGDRNIARAPDIDYGIASDAFEPSTNIVIINKGYGAPNILLDKPYLIIIIKKNIYDYVRINFDYTYIYQDQATYHDMGDYDIYAFDFSTRVNTKYRIEVMKENVTTVEEANKHLEDVKNNLYFSHATRLLDNDMALAFYEMGFLTGIEQQLTNHEAYEAGYENGYDDGYYDGKDDGYYQGYEDGFDDGKSAEYDKGFKDGYRQGSNDSFLKDISRWFGPMVLIVLIAGAYVTARNRRGDA